MKEKMKNINKSKLLKMTICILVSILIIELIFFGIKIYNDRQNTSYYQIASDIVQVENGYVGVGLSDFKNSKFNKYEENGYQKAVIWKFNEKNEIIKEAKLDLGFKSYFNNVEKIENGYIAVGTIQMTKNQVKDSVGEGMIVKYDKDFKIVWRKNIKILDNTEFTNVKIDEKGNIIVVGRSVYAADMIGNHKTGGAIMMRFDSEGKEQMRVNYGGPQTGVYNDLLIEKDGYVVVGASSNATGVIRKYNFEGKEIWRNIYAYTDQKGFTSIEKVKDDYIVTGAKISDEKDTSKYKALIVKYNKNGKLEEENTYKESKISRFDDIIYDNDNLLAVGFKGTKEKDNLTTDGIIIKYDEQLNEKKTTLFELEKNEVYSKIYKEKDNYLLLGYTNSKYKPAKTNGYDYYPVFDKYDNNLIKKK